MVRRISTLLVLDDDEATLRECAEAVRPRRVIATTRARDALALAQTEQPDLVLVDLWLGAQLDYRGATWSPRRDTWGIDVIRDLRAAHPELVIILISNSVCLPYQELARDAGASAAMHKCIGFRKMIAVVEADMLRDEPARTSPVSLALNEFEHVARTYIDNARNATQSAEDLVIDRETFYRKLRGKAPIK